MRILAAFLHSPNGVPIPAESNVRKPRQPEEGHFHSGEKVPKSGIYAVAHSGAHRAAHCILLLVNESFPGCEQCRGDATFRLLRAAPYIFEDADFRTDGREPARGPRRVK